MYIGGYYVYRYGGVHKNIVIEMYVKRNLELCGFIVFDGLRTPVEEAQITRKRCQSLLTSEEVQHLGFLETFDQIYEGGHLLALAADHSYEHYGLSEGPRAIN